MGIFFGAILLAFWIVGCMGVVKAPKEAIKYYTLEYDPPKAVVQNRLPAVIRVPRFQVDPPYNSHRMIYTDQAFQRNAYHYHQWRANPGDLITAFMARDLRQSSIVKAVFVYSGSIPASHVIEGVVEEFYEKDSRSGWYAVLSVSITLIKVKGADISQRILFQKSYHVQKKCLKKNPQALARAMSQAMAEVSELAIKDIQRALIPDA
jgi:cholesterol transport system auxiliary component